MHRKKLLDLLERYRESRWMTGAESESVVRTVAFVRRRADCFHRALLEGHITGSAWLLNDEGTDCLLTHHRKLGLWLQPGGHADGEPDVLSVALREATEESGIEGIEAISQEIFDVDVHRIPARPGEPEHLHYDVRFLVRAPAGAKFRVSEESHDLRWVERDRVRELSADASVLRMAEKWNSGAGKK